MDNLKKKIVAHWDMINRLATRRFGERALAEEAALFVMDGLLEKDGYRIRSYRAEASFPAYLASVSHRLLEDFARKRFGRKRPPKWIERLGGVWLRLYRLLCLERLDIHEAIAITEQAGYGSGGDRVEDAAWSIKQEVGDCGTHQSLELHGDELVFDDAALCADERVQEKVEDAEKRDFFRLLFTILTGIDETVIDSNLDKLSGVNIMLLSEEKLMLKLCYQDDISVTRAGKMLGYNRHQIHGRMRRLLVRIRNEFEKAGIDREILELLR